MSSWLRTVVICLLALALPAQGLAAATMALCQPPPIVPASAAEHCHELAAPVAADKAGAGDAQQADTVWKGKCSACAACGMAAALPAMALPVPEPGLSGAAFGAVVFTVEKFVAPGPERPPRTRQA